MSLWWPGTTRDRRRAIFSVSGVWMSTMLLVVPCSLGLFFVLRALVSGGHADAPAGGTAIVAAEASNEKSQPAAPAPREIVLREASWDQVREMIAAREGKVVVVDVWMSTCGPCLERLPHVLGLPQGFDGVACITVNCDYGGFEDSPVATYRADALAALTKLDAGRLGVDHVLLTDPLLDFMERQGIEATPTVLIYDRAGKLAKKFDNANAFSPEEEFTSEEIDAVVRRLIEDRLQ